MAGRKKEQVLTMVPSDQITFKPPFDSVSDSKLTLTNPSTSHVAFKIKTTAPQRYCVRPNAGIINPAGDAEIKVMLQPGVIDERHKFMVQSIYVSDDYNKLETKEEKKEFVAELWKSPAENPVMSSKLICNFLQPEPVSDSQYETVIEEPVAKVSAPAPEPIPEEPLYQSRHHQSVKEPPKEQKKEAKKVTIRNTEDRAQNDQSEEIRRLRAELQDAMKQIEILSSAPPPSTTAQSPEQQKLFLVLLFVAFISGFVLSCLV